MRLAPAWLEKKVRKRDCGCRFPNCARTKFSNIHHMLEWVADHGPTDLDNLIEVCATHHRYLHEGGWKVRGSPDGELWFIASDGQIFYGRAPQVEPVVGQRVQKMATSLLANNMATHSGRHTSADAAWGDP